MTKRIVRKTCALPGEDYLANIPALLRPIYANRGIRSERELEKSLEHLIKPDLLGNIDTATHLLETAIRERQSILIVGDFDADGATSTALSLRALTMLGASHVEYLVPNRFEYGYGLTPEIVAEAAKRQPDLIMTVDNGVSSVQGVAAANELGITVLVTDHHLPGETLPAAAAIVNPNLRNECFPSKHLAGVGVAFYVMLALRARLRDSGWFSEGARQEPNLAELLDLVALGTVADVVPLDHNNRILVEQGLRRIRAGKSIPGIKALLQVAGRDHRYINASDLGFCVGPRLNAAGRLEDMSIGIECLLTNDESRARTYAAQLDQLNHERRAIESDMKAQAVAELEALHLDDTADMPIGLCLYNPEWHQGVIGILASRIKDIWHRPVIAFAQASETELKGSARSIPGLHIRDALDAVAARHPELIQKFGGHAMAAGLSIHASDYPAFQHAFDQEVRLHLDEGQLQGVIQTEGALASGDFVQETARLIANAGPWGQHFSEPLFDNAFTVVSQRVVGDNHLKLQLQPEESHLALDAIAFNQADVTITPGQKIQAAYKLDINRFRGMESLQLVVEYFEPAG